MKDYQRIISAIIIGVAIIIGSLLLSNAISEASASIGSQIAAALSR